MSTKQSLSRFILFATLHNVVVLHALTSLAAPAAPDSLNATDTRRHSLLLVNTTSGPVMGAHVGADVVAWRGIPYAEPPLGPLRFEPPRAITRPREHIIDARQYGALCHQFQYDLALPLNSTVEGQSEDCLTVNIFRSVRNATGGAAQASWANSSQDAGAEQQQQTSGLLPVLIWVHGGAFTQGSGWLGLEPPDLIRDHPELIIASFNYRLNIFGFPDTRAISNDTANAGMRDARLALLWLRDNVRAFGGDPARIVGVGSSSGSTTLATMLLAFVDDPVINGAILMSGPVTLAGSPSDSSEFRRVAAIAGCSSLGAAATNNSSSDVESTNTTTTTTNTTTATTTTNTTNTTSAGGSDDMELERDRRELECMKRVDAQQLARAVSNATLNQMGAPRGGYPRFDNVLVFPLPELMKRAQEGRFARVPIVIGNTEHEGDTLVPWTPQGINQTLSDFVTTTIFHCPNAAEARAVASHGVPVWRYLFRGIFPSWKTHPWLRAYHGQDALLLLGAVPGGQPPQPVERAAMAYLRKAWATFVLDPRAGLKHFGWPMYMPQGNVSTLVELFRDNQVGAEYSSAEAYDKACV